MAVTIRPIRATPEQVFAVVADGWLYPSWVVGASRMREVEDAWPAPGSHLHHSFGVWPLLLNDETTMLEWDPPRRAVLRAKGWPLGEAEVTLEAKPRRDGCVVRLTEVAVAGPGALIPRPVLDVPVHIRNVETLHRLAFVAEGRA